jgi:phospholipase/carboxylesterase
MTDPLLTTVEIEPTGAVRSSVIWMHGLGADANDFGPIVPEMRLPAELGIRFVFPNAPFGPVTINGGMRMRAWYDVLSMDLPRRKTPMASTTPSGQLWRCSNARRQRGVPAERIVLAGFSQGGAMALHTGLRYPDRLAGILALVLLYPAGRPLSANGGRPISTRRFSLPMAITMR